jgi:Ca2+-binding RTX toxin-like protein
MFNAKYFPSFLNVFKSVKATRRRRNNAYRKADRCRSFDELEHRLMFSTIAWINRGTCMAATCSGGSTDSDGFFATFGTNANVARQVVDRAIDDWEEVIQNFNYRDGSNRMNLQVGTANISAIAVGGATSADRDGKPTAGRVTVDSDGNHFLDRTADDAEFATLLTPFRASATITGVDFYTTMVHEIGHAVGIVLDTSLAVNRLVTNTGISDPNGGGTLRAVNIGGGPVEFTMTSGGHLWEGPGTATTGSLPTHPNDLMNEGRALPANHRFLITDTDARFLRDVYGYSVNMPSQINTFLVDRNATTGALRILGDGGHNRIEIDHNASDITVRVTGIETFSEKTPLAAVTSMVVNAGHGNDVVDLNKVPSGKPITVRGESGFDTLVGPDGFNTWSVTGADAGSLGTDSRTSSPFSSVEHLLGGGSSDTFSIQPGGSISFDINGGDGRDTLSYSSFSTGVSVDLSLRNATAVQMARAGGIFSIENATGGRGNDTLIGDGRANTLVGSDGNDHLFGNGDIDDIYGGLGDDYLYGGEATDYLYGQGGNDHVYGGGGDDWIFGGSENDTLFGEAGADQLFGELGNDRLDGGHDHQWDRLTGGSGLDTFIDHVHRRFVFDWASGQMVLRDVSEDSLVDFNATEDTKSRAYWFD